jgi:hypothetical protein
MTESYKSNSSRGRARPRVKTLAGYLASSLDLEEQITNGVYQDYRQLKNWPSDIDRKIFDAIKERLNMLIDDTEKHKKILLQLQKAL